MTDTLLKPEDTGEIRRDPGKQTMNLAPYAAGLPPALRRPDASGEIPLVIEGSALDALQGPQPKPRPIPKPNPRVDDRALSAGEEIVWDVRSATYVRPPRRPFAYAGRHRPGWHGTWRRFLADVASPLGRAL
jgi:hypothetical protein